MQGLVKWLPGIVLSAGRNRIQCRLTGKSGGQAVLDNPTPVIALPDVMGNLPLAFHAKSTDSFTVTVEVVCARTERALEVWRLETYEAIRAAYQLRLSEYNEAVAQAATQTIERARGRTPLTNRKLEATELKRAAIAILANQQMFFDAITEDATGIPLVNIPAARENDPRIRFLEQAFEWENMAYIFYPYFWGRKDPYWKQKILTEDLDSSFEDFLRAGAARVQLPVRPGFENAVDHYCRTLEPWEGGDLPTITDPLYLPFHDEQRKQRGAPGDEVPFGDPWEVRIPTTLMILRRDGSLPKWKNDNGEWAEVAASGGGGTGGNGG
jgi:hypothetical protein